LSALVADASVALAWLFPDEGSEYADAVLEALKDREVVVPAIWPVEIANAIWVGERRKRIRPQDVRGFIDLLEDLNIVQDSRPFASVLSEVVAISRECGISAYDAAYLDVALRHGAPFATLDKALERAARAAGIEIVKLQAKR